MSTDRKFNYTIKGDLGRERSGQGSLREIGWDVVTSAFEADGGLQEATFVLGDDLEKVTIHVEEIYS